MKERKKKKRETENEKTISFKLSLQRKQEKEESNTFFQTLYSIQRVQVKEEEKQTSFQSHFTHLFLRRARKTKITLCFDGYLILLITPGSSLFTLSEEENRRVWDVSLGEV
jgi:hypothetical protein